MPQGAFVCTGAPPTCSRGPAAWQCPGRQPFAPGLRCSCLTQLFVMPDLNPRPPIPSPTALPRSAAASWMHPKPSPLSPRSPGCAQRRVNFSKSSGHLLEALPMRWHHLDLLSPHAGYHAPIFTSPSVIQHQMWLSRCWLRTSPALRLGSYLLTSALRAQRSPLSCAKAFQSTANSGPESAVPNVPTLRTRGSFYLEDAPGGVLGIRLGPCVQ